MELNIVFRIVILSTILITGCEPTERIHGVYVFKYGIGETENSALLNKYTLPTITCFDDDSVRFVRFEMDKSILGSETETNYYTQSDSFITIFDKDRKDALKIKFNSSDSLILTKPRAPQMKRVLIPLPLYEQKRKSADIIEAFQQHGFKWNSTDEMVEFDSSGYFLRFNRPAANFYAKRWDFVSYESELFLTLLDFKTQLIHIKTYKDGVLTGVIYSEKDQLVTLTPIEVTPTFNTNELLGEWIELLDENMPLPPVADLDNYQLRETLTFGEHSLIRRKYFGHDTVRWIPDQFRNKIILNPPVKRIGNQWNVERLENDELTIMRYGGSGIANGRTSETIVFKRKLPVSRKKKQ